MKNYIKYIVLFIILILIGVVGINLYSNDTLKSKETVTNKANAKENKEDSTTSKKEQEEENQESKGATEEITVKNETTSPTETSSTTKTESSKEEPKESSTESSGLVSESINPKDLTVSGSTSNNSTANNNNSTLSNQDVIEIDVTNSNYATQGITESTSTTINQNNSPANSTNTNNTSSSTNTETIILEVETSVEEVTTTVSSQATQSSTPNSTTASSATTATNSNNSTSSNNTTTNNNSTTNNSSSSSSTTTEKNTQTTTTPSSSTSTSTTEDITSGKKTNISFSDIDNCINNKVIKTVKGSNGKTVKIRTCIEKFNLNNQNSMMQNFAITDQFIYFSNPARGAWVKQESTYQQMGNRAALKKTSANYVTRINRSTNTYQRIYVEFAGHTQSFDVTNITNNEQIYMNYFAKLYKGSLGYGSRYVGVTAIKFKSNKKSSGVEVVPSNATSISSDGKKFSILKSSSYYTDGQFNSEKYYNKVVSIGSSSGKMTNPEVAVDEEHNRIAFVSGTKAYIYNLEDFTKGNATLLKTFTIASGKQGIELYNGYLYLWTGNKTHILYKYKVSTGKLANKISFNLYNYYGNGKGNEAEGISIYKGNVYIGIPGSKCNGKTCNDIFLVEGL